MEINLWVHILHMTDYETQKAIETYKSLINVSLELYKTLLLINGGGIIAILAYIGTRPIKYVIGNDLRNAGIAFLVSLFFTVLAIGSSYYVQFMLHKNRSESTYFIAAKTLTILSIAAMLTAFICGALGIL